MKNIFQRAEAVFTFLCIFISLSLSIEGAQKADYSSFLKNKLEMYANFGDRFIYNKTILSIKNIRTGKVRVVELTTVGALVTVEVPPVGSMLNNLELLERIHTKTLPTEKLPFVIFSVLFFLLLILFGNYLKLYLINLKQKLGAFLSSPNIRVHTLVSTVINIAIVSTIAVIAFLFGVANVIKLTTVFASWLSSELTQEMYYTVLAVFIAISALLSFGKRFIPAQKD